MKKLISIITAVYNGESSLEKSTQSVLSQKTPDIEYLIIDGGSTDGTLKIIKKYADNIDYFVTGKDKGIYDAWNKGIQKATGEWVMFIGCDDMLAPDALLQYKQFISNCDSAVDFISSKKQMVDINGKFVRVEGWPWEWPRFLSEMTVAHPASLHSRRLFKNYGNFDIDFKIVGDYEFLLRAGPNLKAGFLDKVTVTMAEGGTSDTSMAIIEATRARLKTGKQAKYKALIDFCTIYSKFKIKKTLRKFGLNVYLKR